jgi:tripartite-type tricarboxylate transporter receptor subunit TctC
MSKRRWGVVQGLVYGFIALTLLIGTASHVQSQDKYPTKAIDIIVPVVPGAGADFCARVMADFAKKRWNVPINVINKPGGNSVPANLEVHQAKPDGYTVLADSQSSCSFLEISTKDLPFRVLDRTFTAISTSSPHVFYVPSSSPVKNMKDLEAEIKRDPGTFTWATFGGVGAGDYVMRQFFKAIGVDVPKTKPVVVRGSAETLTLVAGNHIRSGTGSPAPGLPHVKAGTVRAVAVTGYRVADYPDVATAAEQGYPAVNAIYWWGINGPPKLPPHVVAKWDEVAQQMIKDPEVVAKLKNIGFAPFYLNPRDARELVRKEMEEAMRLWGVR